ncbi:MAG: hypothetical protein RIF41_02215 [Polyangiaceae bacterium]
MPDRLMLTCGVLAIAWCAQASCLVYDEDLLVEGDDDAGPGPSSSASGGAGGAGAFGGGPASVGGMGGSPASSSSGPASSSSSSSSSASSSSSTGGGGGGVAWINELHYDNEGGDVGEGVEIAGTAGMSLMGWSLVLYNGSNGTSYATIMLSGSLPSQQGGKGCLWFPVTPIQNGDPDGLVLVDAQSQIVQFLSYEGTFAATNGPAMGMMSTDIGVAETNVDLAGMSLQLTGSGDSYASFTWSGPITATADQPNTGQTLQ